MRNIVSIVMIVAILIAMFVGCGTAGTASDPAVEAGEPESFGAAIDDTAVPEPEVPAETDEPGEVPVETAVEETAEADAPAADSTGSNILVLYFSAADNDGIDAIASATVTSYEGSEYGAAQLAATWIADYTGGNLSAIVTAESYPDDYDAMADMAKEQADNSEHPALSSHVDDFDQYNTVFLVYPIWWYQMPMALYSVFDEYDFTGKNILIATTHAGSQLAGGLEDAAEYEPGANVVDNGFTVAASSVASARGNLESWLEEVSEYWR